MNVPDTSDLLQTLLLGVAAGLVGGLAGVGGSVVVIPGLHLVFGDDPASRHHLYMAAAMMVNVAVAFPAARQHARAGAIRRDLLPSLLWSALVGIVAGVLTSNLIDGDKLKVGLAAFIGLYCLYLVARILGGSTETQAAAADVNRGKLLVSGGLAGFVGGVLGLGGGVILVPMLQLLCGIRLKQAIATSSAVICVTALIGAGIKVGTLGDHDQSIRDALLLAALMAPTAVLGAALGARLTHRLPLQWVRGVIIALLLLAASRMAGAW
ncbi:MAG: sulfite exporter TauE/SafE family protein [Pyrinomonadaceae bacterium]|nr:sulfite exporter TauE/SafE family protein [Phycisphaerales bacterium]